jgi:hypothetical protein
MTNLTKDELASLIASVVTQVMQGQSATPKTSSSKFLAKGEKADAADLASRDQSILNAFHRKGFKDVVLINRANPSAPFNVKPYKAWLAEGRVVRKGQHGVKGLFHIHQTDALPVKAAAKPAITTEQKELFAKAKAAFKAKQAKGKPQPTLV